MDLVKIVVGCGAVDGWFSRFGPMRKNFALASHIEMKFSSSEPIGLKQESGAKPPFLTRGNS